MEVRNGCASAERLRERLTEESPRLYTGAQASRSRWVVPTQQDNRKSGHRHSAPVLDGRCSEAGRDNQGGTTGV
ncbi:MAG TPA: hypothetical protein VFQ30_01710 [Ktedonobacteraceae bacterium]|nr:hypothetical protein [Ktedonobacteraceae bacterium]